jgi:integrase
MIALNWGDLSDERGTVFVSTTVKGGSHHKVPLSPEVTTALHDYFLSRSMPNPGEPIFVDSRGHRLTRGTLAYVTMWIGRRAGIKRFGVRPHVIRHSVNVLRRQSGIDSTTRSALLTHTSPQSIISYEHTDPRELIPARAQQRRALEEILKGGSRSEKNYENGLWRQLPTQGDK